MSLTITETNNAIIVPLEIKLEKLHQLRELITELKSIDTSEATVTSVTDKKTTDDESSKKQSKLSKKIHPDYASSKDADALQNTIEKYLKKAQTGTENGLDLLTNPKHFIMSLLSNPYITAALVAAGLGAQILNWLMIQGNVLDRHFKRIIADENLAGVRRMERQKTQAGLGRNVIFTTHSGSIEPEFAFNSYEAVRTGEITQTDAFQIRKGYRF